MELLKILLVDDEKIILRGLLETYDWESMGYEVIGAADSGEAALALIEDEEPDVVLTDVRMKKISGLDLIEKTKMSRPGIKFVVVSAYKDFEYARKACREGALAYLVKPVDDEELESVMRTAYEKCMEDRKKNAAYESWKKILTDDKGGFLGQMIERYVKDIISEQELKVLTESLSRDIGIRNYFVAVCVELDAVYKVTNQMEYDARRYLLFTELEKQLKENFQIWEYSNEDNSHIFLINLGDTPAVGKIKLLLEKAKKESGYHIVCAISNTYAGLGGMKTAYKQVQKLFGIACEAGAGLLTLPKDTEVSVNSQYFTDIESQLLKAVKKNSEELLKEVFEKIVYSLPSNEETAKTYLHRLTVQTEVMLDDSYGMSDNIKIGFANFYGMIQQYTLLRLIDILYKLLGTVIKERLTVMPAMTEDYFRDYMKDALSYIQEHLRDEDLSIIVVADEVFLNPVYFGRLFKNMMGITFKKYVLNERMGLAKKLIMETSQSIAQIGAKVGIPNPSYFSQLFKQVTGMLPSEYKKENSR